MHWDLGPQAQKPLNVDYTHLHLLARKVTSKVGTKLPPPASCHQLGSARLQPSVRTSGALYLESKICRPTEKKSLYMKPAKIAKKPVQVNTSLRQNCSCQQSPLARAAEQPKLTTMYRAVNKDGWVNRKVSAFMQSQIPARNSRMP